ncbi:MAG TPA: phosphate/phosphite/phosphonate ABC transporter substrate-binding protein [Acidimicrobiales bacterium]|nr:phosphate/phosphite/phosphonate ABC transporter substrate-binding protein [Acidimicrobiales bacterium]
MTEPLPLSRRRFLQGAGAFALAGVSGLALGGCGGDDEPTSTAAGGSSTSAAKARPTTLRFGVGPLLSTTTDTKAAYDPFFAWLAGELGVKHELQAVDSWGGISVALGSDQLDLAWMGPFGYVLANERSGAQAIATVKYDEKPIYHAIIVGRPGLEVTSWPEDGKGKSISFAEVSSTSGWLVPTFWFKGKGIDPKTYFKYTEGASHPANELAVASGQVDFATDYDRNRNSMIETGKLKETDTKVVWTSDPLPNDAIGIPKGFDPGFADEIQAKLLSLTPEMAKGILPNHYTGFVAATNDSYKSIRDAAVSLDALQR